MQRGGTEPCEPHELEKPVRLRPLHLRSWSSVIAEHTRIMRVARMGVSASADHGFDSLSRHTKHTLYELG